MTPPNVAEIVTLVEAATFVVFIELRGGRARRYVTLGGAVADASELLNVTIAPLEARKGDGGPSVHLPERFKRPEAFYNFM